MTNLGQFLTDREMKKLQKMFVDGAENKYYKEVTENWNNLDKNDKKLGKDIKNAPSGNKHDF